MATETWMRLRMDAGVKEKVEALYREMGMSFAEGIRMFAAESLRVHGLPFQPVAEKADVVYDLAGSLRGYATAELLATEEEALSHAFERSVSQKYGGDRR